MDRKELILRQRSLLEETRDVFGCDRSVARKLLKFYKWNSQDAIAAFSRDPKRVAKDLGLQESSFGGGKSNSLKMMEAQGESCGICFGDDEMMDGLECGHIFCKGCWQDYVTSAVTSQKSLAVSCMSQGCSIVLEDVAVASLISDAKLKKVYLNQLVDSFVSENRYVEYCPTPGCGLAIELVESGAGNESVKCKNGHEWCFRCRQRPHEPAPCKIWSFLEAREKAGDVNSKAMDAISRPCPSCGTRISKNFGCNHMTCASCQYHFCWQCMGKFGSGPKGGSDGYGSHKCQLFTNSAR